jgi:hypothetical protein
MVDNPEAVLLSLESRLQALRDPAAADLLGTYYRELRGALSELLQDAAKRFGNPLPHRHAELVVFSLLDGASQQWALDPAPLDLEDLRDVHTHTLTDLFSQQPPQNTHAR